MRDIIERLRQAGSVGADLSPGDPLCTEAAAEIERLRAELEAARRERDNLATMIRRGAWLAKKQVGDTGLKVWAGHATDLLMKYGLQGSPLRDDASISGEPK